MIYPLTAERIAETNALLAAYEAAHDFNGHWATYAACEAQAAAEWRMDRGIECKRIRDEMDRITRANRQIIAAAVAALMKPRTHEAVA